MSFGWVREREWETGARKEGETEHKEYTTSTTRNFLSANSTPKRMSQNKLIILKRKASIRDAKWFLWREKMWKPVLCNTVRLLLCWREISMYCIRFEEFSWTRKCQNHTSARCMPHAANMTLFEFASKIRQSIFLVIFIGFASSSNRIGFIYLEKKLPNPQMCHRKLSSKFNRNRIDEQTQIIPERKALLLQNFALF